MHRSLVRCLMHNWRLASLLMCRSRTSRRANRFKASFLTHTSEFGEPGIPSPVKSNIIGSNWKNAACCWRHFLRITSWVCPPKVTFLQKMRISAWFHAWKGIVLAGRITFSNKCCDFWAICFSMFFPDNFWPTNLPPRA